MVRTASTGERDYGSWRLAFNRGRRIDIMELAGFVIEGRDKSKVLGTNIWRSKKFEAVEGQGYWPNDIARPY